MADLIDTSQVSAGNDAGGNAGAAVPPAAAAGGIDVGQDAAAQAAVQAEQDKFAGKSVEEIRKAYEELELKLGQQGQELGTLRQQLGQATQAGMGQPQPQGQPGFGQPGYGQQGYGQAVPIDPLEDLAPLLDLPPSSLVYDDRARSVAATWLAQTRGLDLASAESLVDSDTAWVQNQMERAVAGAYQEQEREQKLAQEAETQFYAKHAGLAPFKPLVDMIAQQVYQAAGGANGFASLDAFYEAVAAAADAQIRTNAASYLGTAGGQAAAAARADAAQGGGVLPGSGAPPAAAPPAKPAGGVGFGGLRTE